MNKVKLNYISVIIPVFRDTEGLKSTLNSLNQQTISKSKYEIVVANDGADSTISEICRQFQTKEVTINPNQGSYNARNAALVKSVGEFLAFTDADLTLPTNWLEQGLNDLEDTDYTGGGVDLTPHDHSNTIHRYEKLIDFNIQPGFKYAHFLVTANLFTRRKVIEKIGGFDRRLLSGGDLEFGNRVYLSNQFKQHYSPKLTINHPHRNFIGIQNKKNRVITGQKKLYELYPERFPEFRFQAVNEFIHTLKPPTSMTNDKRLFFLSWLQKLIDFYYKFRIYKLS